MTVGAVIDRLPQLTRLWQLDAGAVPDLIDAGPPRHRRRGGATGTGAR